MKKPVILLCLLTLGGFPLHADSIGHKLDKGLGKMKHALGWDSMNLKTIESDSAGRPTLERDVNADNTVERVTSYHPNGRKKEQRLTVVTRKDKRLIYDEQESWEASGDLEHSYLQDDAYGKDGDQVRGSIREKTYEYGRLVKEVQKKYSPGADANKVVYVRTITYYDDGDMKERITERPLDGEKERETWSEEKGERGRLFKHVKWLPSKNDWE